MNWIQRRRSDSAWQRAVYAAAAMFYLTLLGCGEESPPEEWIRLPAELKVEVARTLAERRRGLKFRQSLPGDQGMYFVFDKEQPVSFYMRDTRIPLSIAFIRGDGIIESIADMIPLDERSVSSAGPAKFALEAKRGWFEEKGIRPGDKVVLRGDRVSFRRRVRR